MIYYDSVDGYFSSTLLVWFEVIKISVIHIIFMSLFVYKTKVVNEMFLCMYRSSSRVQFAIQQGGGRTCQSYTRYHASCCCAWQKKAKNSRNMENTRGNTLYYMCHSTIQIVTHMLQYLIFSLPIFYY